MKISEMKKCLSCDNKKDMVLINSNMNVFNKISELSDRYSCLRCGAIRYFCKDKEVFDLFNTESGVIIFSIKKYEDILKRYVSLMCFKKYTIYYIDKFDEDLIRNKIENINLLS